MRPKWSRSGREHVFLRRQIAAAGVDQVDAGQVVFARHFLRAHVLFHRHGEVGAALDRGVVADDHAFTSRYSADAGDDACAGGGALVHVVGGELGEFQKRRAGVNQAFDALARQQLAARGVLLARVFRAADGDLRDFFLQVGDGGAQRGGVRLELVGTRIDLAVDDGHACPGARPGVRRAGLCELTFTLTSIVAAAYDG